MRTAGAYEGSMGTEVRQAGDRRPLRVAHLTTTDLTLRYLLLGQLRRLSAEGYEVTGISAPGPNAGALQAEGIRHLPWRNATRSWNPVADVRALAELVALLRRERFDLVHTHNPKPGVLGRVAARLAGTPLVVNTVHGLYATPEDRLRKRAAVLGLEWLAGRCSDLELYQSEEDLAWAGRLRLARKGRSHLLGNGTDTGFFDPAQVPPERAAALRRELGLPADALVVGAVGRLVAEKGYRELFAAARAVRQADPRVRFLAVGSPRPREGRRHLRGRAGRGRRGRAGHRLARRRPRPAGRDGRVRARLLARGDAPVGHRGRGHGQGPGPDRHPWLPRGRPPRPRGPAGPPARPGRPGRRHLCASPPTRPCASASPPPPGAAPWNASARRTWPRRVVAHYRRLGRRPGRRRRPWS